MTGRVISCSRRMIWTVCGSSWRLEILTLVTMSTCQFRCDSKRCHHSLSTQVERLFNQLLEVSCIFR